LDSLGDRQRFPAIGPSALFSPSAGTLPDENLKEALAVLAFAVGPRDG
jgi:hypothetical protein